MNKFIEALKLFNRVDPVCKIMINNKGEYILMVNGEIHLERCVWDLEKDFFKDKV